jgi:hypothetical protein
VPVLIEWSISCCRVIRFLCFVGLASLVSVAADGVVLSGVDEAAGAGVAAAGVGEAAGVDEAAGAGAGAGVVAAGAGVAGAVAAGGVAASVPAAGAVWANARPVEKVATTVAAKAAEIREYSFIGMLRWYQPRNHRKLSSWLLEWKMTGCWTAVPQARRDQAEGCASPMAAAAAPPPLSDLPSSASRCGRTTVTVQTASAATLAETLPSNVRSIESWRAPRMR